MSAHSYQNLEVWQRSIELTVRVYGLCKLLPKEELYALSDQIKRAAVSVPSNIAEGAGRNSNKEFKYFLSVANGSAFELQTQLLLIGNLELTDNKKLQPLIELCIEIQKMNYSLQKKL